MSDFFNRCCSPAIRIFKRLAPTAAFFIVLILIAAVAYAMIEGADPLRSLYWSVVTGFTVGFGDVLPSAGPGMILVILYIPAACITYAVLVAHIIGIVIDARHEFTEEEQRVVMSGIQNSLSDLEELKSEVQAVIDHLKIDVDYSSKGANRGS